MSRHACRQAGFTLMEVLVALIIVALGMGALMSALTSAADNVQRLREKSFAEWVGLNQLAATRLARALPGEGKTEGDVDFAGGRWHWVQQVTDMQVPGLRRIEVQVRRLPGVAKEETGKQASASAAAGSSAGGTSGSASASAGAGAGEAVDGLATVTGFRGDAIASPDGTLAEWDTVATANGGGTVNGGGTTAPTQGEPGR